MTNNKQSKQVSEESTKQIAIQVVSKKDITFHTQYNHEPCPGQPMDKTSHTVPDQNMSVIEIMKRFASGRPVSGNINPMYEEEGQSLMPDLARMELTDRMQTIERLSQEFSELRQKLHQEQQDAQKSAEYKKWEEDFIKAQEAKKAGEIASPGTIAEK